MKGVLLASGLLVGSLCLARDPFTSLENSVGYIVLEKGGKIQRYLVIEGKGGVIIEPVDTIPQQLRGGKEGFRKDEGGRK